MRQYPARCDNTQVTTHILDSPSSARVCTHAHEYCHHSSKVGRSCLIHRVFSQIMRRITSKNNLQFASSHIGIPRQNVSDSFFNWVVEVHTLTQRIQRVLHNRPDENHIRAIRTALHAHRILSVGTRFRRAKPARPNHSLLNFASSGMSDKLT